jgi:glycerate kinase
MIAVLVSFCIQYSDGTSLPTGFFIPGYKYKSVIIKNPVGKEVPSEYCIQKETNTAIIEMAKASGLQMLPQKLRDRIKHLCV